MTPPFVGLPFSPPVAALAYWGACHVRQPDPLGRAANVQLSRDLCAVKGVARCLMT